MDTVDVRGLPRGQCGAFVRSSGVSLRCRGGAAARGMVRVRVEPTLMVTSW